MKKPPHTHAHVQHQFYTKIHSHCLISLLCARSILCSRLCPCPSKKRNNSTTSRIVFPKFQINVKIQLIFSKPQMHYLRHDCVCYVFMASNIHVLYCLVIIKNATSKVKSSISLPYLFIIHAHTSTHAFFSFFFEASSRILRRIIMNNIYHHYTARTHFHRVVFSSSPLVPWKNYISNCYLYNLYEKRRKNSGAVLQFPHTYTIASSRVSRLCVLRRFQSIPMFYLISCFIRLIFFKLYSHYICFFLLRKHKNGFTSLSCNRFVRPRPFRHTHP